MFCLHHHLIFDYNKSWDQDLLSNGLSGTFVENYVSWNLPTSTLVWSVLIGKQTFLSVSGPFPWVILKNHVVLSVFSICLSCCGDKSNEISNFKCDKLYQSSRTCMIVEIFNTWAERYGFLFISPTQSYTIIVKDIFYTAILLE